jgi:hypothetical protein
MAALQALLAEADRLKDASIGMMQDPVLDTSHDSIAADAEAMLSRWDGDVENYTQQLNEMADKLTGSDLGQTPGMEEAVQQASAKAEELRAAAGSLQGAAPAKVTANVQLDDGCQLAFEAPIASRDTAVADILNAFAAQLELHEASESEQKGPEAAPAEAPADA